MRQRGLSTAAIVGIVVTVVVVVVVVATSAVILLKIGEGGATSTTTTTTTTPGTTTTTAPANVQITYTSAEVYDNTSWVTVQVKNLEFTRIGSCAVYITVGGVEQLVDVKPGIDPGEQVPFTSYFITGLAVGNSYQARLASSTGTTIKAFTINATSPWLPSPILLVAIDIENATAGSTVLVIRHVTGDPITTAFTPSSSGAVSVNDWTDMEVRVNGAKIVATNVKLNGSTVSSSIIYDFIAGDVLELELVTPSALHPSDVIKIIYRPASEELATAEVP